MRRDDLANKTEATNVTEIVQTQSVHINQTESFNYTSSILSDTDSEKHQGFDSSDTFQFGSNTTTSGQKFYSSYDPEVGINTATFLGGLLLVLVIYVIYRTKVRKRLLRAIHKCTMKYFPEEYMQNPGEIQEGQEPLQNAENVENAEWLSEGAKMIWQERAKLSLEPDTPKCVIVEQRCSDQCDAQECVCKGCETNKIAIAEGLDVDKEVNMNHLTLQLPVTEENSERATAQWVQNVKFLDRKDLQLNGLILKIPPDLVSNNAKVRSHFNSVTDYCEVDDFVSISERNKSLPLLIEHGYSVPTNYATHMDYEEKYCEDTVADTVPSATQDEYELDSKPSNPQVQHLSGSGVPLDICPIVKVQHFHSRSKRRLTSINRSSSNDSSCSSEGSGTKHPVPTGQTKYIRLQMEDNRDHKNDKRQLVHGNNINKTVARKIPTGRFETCL